MQPNNVEPNKKAPGSLGGRKKREKAQAMAFIGLFSGGGTKQDRVNSLELAHFSNSGSP